MKSASASMLLSLAGLSIAGLVHHDQRNSTYYNPIIPGFNPDPSCIFVPEWDDTFFCATSTFIAFPGMPIYASKDLTNWKLVSHVHSRPEQAPAIGNIARNGGGWYAPTLRYHEGTFYVINVGVDAPEPSSGIFSTTNPYDPDGWSDLLLVDIPGADPDIFWDTDGTIYSVFAETISTDPFTTEIQQLKIDLPSGSTSDLISLTNGTGVQPPEGPHMYFKDGYYWLLLAEGGTGLLHQFTISRSRSPRGPWELDPSNPVLTAINSSGLFQAVGHGDIFHDAAGNYWAVALSIRCGPEYEHWPMNRETVLTPVSWEGDDWPIFDFVRGEMSGPLPRKNKRVPGRGPFVDEDDHYIFAPGSSLPLHFTYWRFPQAGNYEVSPPGHPYRLALTPSNANLTAFEGFDPTAGQTFIGRRQTDTLMKYRVGMEFVPLQEGEEAGVTAFLRQERNAALGLVRLNGSNVLRFRASGPDTPATVVKTIPDWWVEHGIQFEIEAFNFTHHSLAAGPKHAKHLETIALVDNSLFSYEFTGVFVGVYATTNGNGEGGAKSYFSDWRYEGIAQAIGIDEYRREKWSWWP